MDRGAAAMWGRFWFGTQRQERDAKLRNLEVRNSGWAAPMPELPSGADMAPPTGDQAHEIAEFLARVYAHQRC